MTKFLLVALLLFITIKGQCQTFNGTGGAIPDAGTFATCFPQAVSGVGTINGTTGLASVCLNISHTYVGDLAIYLVAPDGTIIPLSITNGGAGVNYTNTCFTATASTSIITGTAPFNGSYLPEGNLGLINDGQNANGSWSLCIQDITAGDAGTLNSWSLLFNSTPATPPVPPANDNPCNALPLNVTANCNYTTHTNLNALATQGVPSPGCAGYGGGDVWFTAVVPAGGAITFDTDDNGSLYDGGMAVYTGTCAALTLVACNNDASTNLYMPKITAGSLTPGSTVWIRVWSFDNQNNGTFGICASVPPAAPVNDEPCNAAALTVGATCNFTTHTLVGATSSSGVPAPGCGDYEGNDVWFTVTVPASGNVFINTNYGTITDADMAVYGGTCTALTLLRCDDLSSVNTPMPAITLTGQVPGSILWIRVWDYGNLAVGTFKICVTEPPPPTNQDCPSAIPLCQNVYSTGVSYSGTGNIGNEINPANSCLASGEKNDVWYTFTVQTSGNLNFTITPNTITEDYDWQVFNLTGHSCSDIYNNPALSVSCNFSATPGATGPTGGSAQTSQDAFGTPYNAVIPVIAGQTYVINVSNFSASTHGYTINFGASTAAIFDNLAPYLQSVNVASTCGGNQLAVNFSENVLCSTLQNADFAVTGPGGPYSVTAWASASCSSGATYGNNIVLTLNPAIAANGAFQVCLTNASASVTDLCGNVAPAACLNFNINSTIPAFPGIGTICQGSAAPTLPSTSNNGVTGTWSPATVSNTTSGDYTFTPTPGQCAPPITLSIIVIAGITPLFNAIPSICSGSAAPALPASSTNGITGTWSPATVSNTTSGIYNFTPDAGQCGLLTTLPVTVNPVVTSNTAISICNNQLPYSWNGNSFPAAGIYPVTLVSSTGCDSIATLNLNVNAAVTSTTNATVCTNQFPYSWNGNSYPNPGTYSFTLLNSSGCDSIATLNLTENGVVTSATSIAICNNQLPYSWNGNSYPAAGAYPVTLLSSTGCDSIATLNLSVNPVVTSSTDIAVCNNQLPYLWNGNSFPAAGIYPVTLVSSTGCDSIATLNLSVNPVVTSTTDIAVCNNQLPYSWNGNSYSSPGNYDATLVSSSGCDSIATLNLSVNPVVTSTTDIAVCNNQLPYSWNGNTYPAAGNYPVTLVSSSGCDSIATLNLSVNPVVTSSTDIAVCNNQLPYSWNGNTYPAAGNYPVTLVSASGCDSIATLNLSVNPVVTSSTDIAVCNNQLPYLWNGNSFPAAGIYPVTLVSSTGCDSIATLNLSVNPVVTSTTDIAVCNNQLPYSWNGNTYPVAGNYPVTLVSASGCDSIATLNLSVNPVVTSTTDIAVCNNQLPYSWNGNTYPAAGNYPVTLVSSSGCDSIATLNLSVNPVVTSSTDIAVCNNQLPYSWNGNTYPAAGNYPVTLVSASGCDSIETLNLSVNPVVTSSTDIAVCNNQLPYSWNGNTYTAAGNYPVTLVSASGCDSIATLNLSVYPVVTSSTDIAVCNNQLPYSWNGNTYPAAGNYPVTIVSASGCDSIATLNLSVNPVVTSSTDIAVCNNQLPYSWNGNSYSSPGNYDATLVSSSGCDSIATLNLSVNPVVTSTTDIAVCNNQLPYSWNGNTYPAAGNYPVTLVSASGCDSIATLNLSVNPVVTSSTDIAVCNNQLPYSWNGNTYPAAGNYPVTLVSASGCDSIATLNLSVNPVVTSSTDITVCNNQLPYSWNGNSYSSPGNYDATLVSSFGCDSIATLNLSVNPVVTSSTDIAVCNNQLPYSWNGNTYPAAGNYPVTLISASGCDSIATLNLSVNPVVTSSTDIAVCNNQLPYSWNGNTYPAAGNYPVTLVSASGCDSIATLNLSVNPVVTSSTDIAVCNNQLPYLWNGNSFPAAGIYPVTLVSSTGCDSIATLVLDVNNLLTSSTPITICNNQLPYLWNGNSYPAAGSYTVTLISSAGCDSLATLVLDVNNVLTSSTPITICNNQLPYLWDGNSYPAAGSYTVTLISSAGCDSLATLVLDVNNVLTSSTPITICNNQLPYLWNGNSYPAAGIYSVTLVSSVGCDSLATLVLDVNNVLTSSTPITICNNQVPYLWNGNSYPAGGIYSVTLVSSDGCDSIATLNLTVTQTLTSNTATSICESQLPYSWNGNSYPAGGIYSVTLVSSGGCDSVATLNLTVTQTLTSNTAISICENQLPYLWNGNSYPAGGIYSVTLVSSVGCDSIATLNLTVGQVLTSNTAISICENQLPYSWNGNNYPAAGIYSVTLVSSGGCDSIATLNLTVGQVLTSNTAISLCENQLPYSWNGNSYPAAGIYSVTLVSSGGCDSIATLNLTVGQVLTSNTAISICENQLPYSWNGNSYPAAGIYSVTLVSSGGCDSIATLNVTVGQVLTSNTAISICENQLPYSWNGNSYPAGGIYSVTLVSSVGCDSIATLNLTVGQVLTSNTAISICENQLPYSWNGNNYSAAGIYSVTLVSSGGCDSIATLNLTVGQVLTSNTAISICENQLPYSWNGNNYPAAGIYSVTLVSSGGCDSIATLNLTVGQVLTSNTAISICENQLPYSWNGNSYPAAGIYSVTLVSSGGCDSIATLNLTVEQVLTSNTAISICENQLPYSWNGNNYPAAGIYSVTLVSGGGCDSIATLNLTVGQLLTSNTAISLCENQLPYSWNGNSYPAGGIYSVTLVSSGGCDSIATLNLSVGQVLTSNTAISICENQLPYSWNGNSYPAAGIYSVTLASGGGCDSIATLNLTVTQTLTSNTATSICESQLPYSWNGNSYPAGGIYSVTLVSSGGCDSVATLNLTVTQTLTSNTAISICESQLPYLWNGNNYPAGGIYSVTLVSSGGCDSIATLNLTVGQLLTSNTAISLCENQLPYSWNGNSYPAGGIYSVTLVSSGGCDSIATLNLSLHTASVSSTPITICNSQLPYSWNGNTYSAAGSYSVTLVSSSGCDSVATIVLTVRNASTSTTGITICNSQLPYSWNGNIYPSAGNYAITLVNNAGCDSVANLHLTVSNIITSTSPIAICSTQLPYSWNGNTYPAAGTYTVMLVSSGGCDSLATLILTVNITSGSTTSITVCDNLLPYSWNGQNYSTAGSYPVTLTSSSGCDSIATLILTVHNTSNSYSSISVCSNSLPYLWNGQAYLASGIYSVTLLNSTGCDSVAQLALTVNPVKTTMLSASICNNELPYSWNGQNYTTSGLHSVTLATSLGCDSLITLNLIINPVKASLTIAATCDNELPFSWNGQNYSTSGIHTITLTTSAGCDSITSLNLTINPVKSSTTAASICSADLPYHWNGQSYTLGGLHTITLTSNAGCDSIATLNLTVNPTPSAPSVISPVIYCQYESTSSLTAIITTPGSQLVWYGSATGGTGSTVAPIPSSASPTNTDYYVSQVNGSCEGARVLIQVIVNNKPDLGPDRKLQICFGQSANLISLYNISGYSTSWTQNQSTVINPGEVTTAGTYQLIIQNTTGCADTALVNLGIQAPVIANAGSDSTIVYNEPYQLSGSGGLTYQWSPGSLLNNAFIPNPTAVLTNDETFILMVKDEIGCADFDTVKLRVLKGPAFYVPTAFSPNGDGLNDIFRPTAVGIRGIEFFRVFNRYGQLVFETSDLSKGWDGTYKGIKQNIDNYVWIIKGSDMSGALKTKQGNVVLIR